MSGSISIIIKSKTVFILHLDKGLSFCRGCQLFLASNLSSTEVNCKKTTWGNMSGKNCEQIFLAKITKLYCMAAIYNVRRQQLWKSTIYNTNEMRINITKETTRSFIPKSSKNINSDNTQCQ